MKWPFQKNSWEKDTDKKLEAILDGIRLSPITYEVKVQAEKALRQARKADNTLFDLVREEVYAAPETNFPDKICEYVLSVIGQIMQKTGVPESNGRDTYRHIYVSIGGKNPVKYEVG